MKDEQLSLKVDEIYRCVQFKHFFIKIIEIDYKYGWVYGLNAYESSYYLLSSTQSSRRIPCGRWDIEYFNRTFIPAIRPNKIWKDLNT